jgi:inner membrane protein
MDPLTHTLVGANLAATRLGEKTRFATAALVIGANLPDIDGVCYLVDGDLALGFRRGWTHGILALVVLPVAFAALLYLLDRWWEGGERRADFRWLLVLSTVAVWSHPTLDWLNTYGMRWLMPFSGRWFYGDAVFIMDIWLWLALGVGFLAGRRPSLPLVMAAALIGAWIMRTVERRAPEYLPLLLVIAVVLGTALLWKGPASRRRTELFAGTGLVVATLYIVARLLLNEATETAVVREFRKRGAEVGPVMAGPDPISPLKWSVVARSGEVYRYGEFDWASRGLSLTGEEVMAARDSEEWRRARQDPSVRGLVTWMRFPAYEIERVGEATHVHMFDARRRGGGRRATVVLGD